LRSSAGYDTMERELWQGRNKEWEEEKRVAAVMDRRVPCSLVPYCVTRA
jgi:hypothetical protein